MMQPASWYVRGDYSYSWMDAGELSGAITPFGSRSWTTTGRSAAASATTSAAASAATSPTNTASRPTCTARGAFTTDFDFKSSVILANLYYDFRPYERFTPYIGVGLGAAITAPAAARSSPAAASACPYDGDSNWTAAGALMAGFSIRIDRGGHAPVSIKDGPVYAEPGRLHLDVGYRFLYLGDAHTGNLVGAAVPTPGPRLDDVTAQEIRVGLRWDIR